MIAVLNWKVPRGRRPAMADRLRVRRSEFVYDGNAANPITSRLIHFGTRNVLLWVEIRRVTRATVAAANRALAGVRTC